MQAATLRGVDFAWRAAPGAGVDYALQMSLSEADFRPLRAGPPIRDASGVLELTDRRFSVRLDGGTLAGRAADRWTWPERPWSSRIPIFAARRRRSAWKGAAGWSIC
jgi:hypothetical protein